jgi:glycerophosphoryl diester phosphodiesterase
MGSPPLLLAHRGWRAAGPENSRASVVEALRRCDGAEVDVIVTADGVPVLRHDERLPDGTAVRVLRLAEARAAARASPDEMPEVSSVLDALGGVGGAASVLNLELKVPGAARALSLAVRDRSRLARVVFTSFYATEVLEALAHFPGRPAGLLIGRRFASFVPPGVSLLAVSHRSVERARAQHPATPIWVWTINDAAAAARAKAARAEAWIGDDVDAMRGWL